MHMAAHLHATCRHGSVGLIRKALASAVILAAVAGAVVAAAVGKAMPACKTKKKKLSKDRACRRKAEQFIEILSSLSQQNPGCSLCYIRAC